MQEGLRRAVPAVFVLLLVALGAAAIPVQELFCPACQEAAELVLDSLPQNATEEKVVAALENLCNVLPRELRADCSAELAPFVHLLNQTDQSIVYKYPPKALCSAVGICTLDCCNTPFTPEQIHLALMSDATQMRVNWVTLQSTPSPTVFWTQGTPGAAVYNATASTATYTKGGWQGFVHSAVMTNLMPATRYFYRVGDSTVGVDMNVGEFDLVPELNFISPPTSLPAYPISFVHYADMGAMDVADRTVDRVSDLVATNAIDFVLHGGDIAYSDGYEALADQFFRKIEVLSAYVPYMTAVGNHEGFFDFAPYLTRFTMPWQGSSPSPFYYAVSFGNLRLIAFNTEGPDGLISIDLEPSGQQNTWLEAELAASAADPAIDWIVAVGHRPLYCSSGSDNCLIDAPIFRGDIEALLLKYNVDLVLTGHRHNYERTFPVFNGVPTATNYSNPQAPVYVVAGIGGCKEGLQGFPAAQPDWSAFRASQYGYATITLASATTLEFAYFSAATNTLIDSFTLVKSQ